MLMPSDAATCLLAEPSATSCKHLRLPGRETIAIGFEHTRRDRAADSAFALIRFVMDGLKNVFPVGDFANGLR